MVQPQFCALHWWDKGSQHWPATQSLVVQQPEMQALLQHWSPDGQSAFELQGQLLPHCWVDGLQHWPARQSPLEWQQA